jgi:hypothetical protein
LVEQHVALLRRFLAHRGGIVERIQVVLNAQRRPSEYLQNAPLLSREFEDCFYILTGVTESQARLRGQLQEAHWASGFQPRDIPGLHNGLIDPAEMVVRGFHLWGQTRWPGRNGRIRYAQTLFNLYLIQQLELLTMRLWDDGSERAGERLSNVQGVLDELWGTSPPDQPVLVRDARWLIPLAQSPATDDLGAYFNVAEKVAEALPHDDRIEIHKASVRMAGGHLRSQIRYHAMNRNVGLNDKSLVVHTRTSNALDFALLIQELVPLLEAYEHACAGDDVRRRLALADAICQAISPDPELFVNRVDLLGPYSMLEHLFITTDPDGPAAYTPMGRRHVRLFAEYAARIGRVVKALRDDCARFRPVAGTYSPYGVLYGFATNLLEHMALKALQPDAESRFGLEDVFVAGGADTRAWVSNWRKLPHLTREVASQFEYPQQFADEIFDRIDGALRRRVSDDEANVVAQTGRLLIVPDADSRSARVADLPVTSIQSSGERLEGRYVVSYQTPGGWVGVSKAVLTEVLADGHDAQIVGLPREAAATLKLMCPNLFHDRSA